MPRIAKTKLPEPLPVRTRLLQAATRLFAQTGYRGTTVDEIVAEAKVNKRMVYHYFGDKERLYHAVLTEAYRGLETVEVEALSHTQNIDELTGAMVRSYFDFLSAHPEFVRLLLFENLTMAAGWPRRTPSSARTPR